MKTKIVSVRLQSLVSISDKAYKATAFDGSEAVLPKSQVFGQDYDVIKSDAYWVAEWVLEQKELQYSNKKIAWYNKDSGCIEPNITIVVETHTPNKIENINVEPIKELIR